MVKPEIAQRQKNEEAVGEREEGFGTTGTTEGEEKKVGDGGEGKELTGEGIGIGPGKVVLRRFHGSVDLDPTRLGRDAGRISDEVVAHLSSLVGAKAKITLEIDIEVPEGIPDDKIRIISENCNTLRFKGHGFEEG